jgi:microcystin-dependent protein
MRSGTERLVADMTQFDYGTIDPTVTSGTLLASELSSFRDALNTEHSGASRPSYAQAGTVWINNSAAPWKRFLFDGTQDQLLGYHDPTTGVYQPVVGGGVGTVASAASVDLGAQSAGVLNITGTTSILSFGSSAGLGQIKVLRFSAQLTIVQSANILTPSGVNVITSAGDQMTAVYLGSGVWSILSYFPAASNASPPGMIAPYAGLFAPPGWFMCDGTAKSRTTYAALFGAIAISTTGNTNGTTTISGVPSIAGMQVGMPISGTNIPAGTVITGGGGTSIVISNAATGTTTGGSVVVCPWGVGDGSTTFNVPNASGKLFAGRDDLQGSPAGLLTATYITNPLTVGASGGSQSDTILQANLPNVNFPVSGITLNNPTHQHTVSGAITTGGTGANLTGGGGTYGVNTLTDSAVAQNTSVASQGSANSGGSGTPLNNLQPTLLSNFIIKY